MHQTTRCKLESDKFKYSFVCDMAASEGVFLRALSVAGPATAIRALGSHLRSADPYATRFYFGLEGWQDFVYSPKEIEMRMANLEGDWWHLVAWDTDPKFLKHDDDESLFQALMHERFTTPILREWMPVIKQQFYDTGALQPVMRFNCDAAKLLISQEGLDMVVSVGLSAGVLRI